MQESRDITAQTRREFSLIIKIHKKRERVALGLKFESQERRRRNSRRLFSLKLFNISYLILEKRKARLSLNYL